MGMYLRSGIGGQADQLGSRGCKIWLGVVCKQVWVWTDVVVGMRVSGGWVFEEACQN